MTYTALLQLLDLPSPLDRRWFHDFSNQSSAPLSKPFRYHTQDCV